MEGTAMRHACVYAIIQFRPFIETGEFANIGVVLMSAKYKYIDFQLLTRSQRVTNFFAEIDRHVYREAVAAFKEEMERYVSLINADRHFREISLSSTNTVEMYFSDLLKTREGLIRFDASRVVLTENPNEKLQELFEFYVNRNFVTIEYQQELLEGKVKKILAKEKLNLQSAKVGTTDFSINFPFVKKDKDKHVVGVIKPLHVAQDDSTRILTTGGGWVDRIRRLKKYKSLPNDVLFVLNAPPETSERRYSAFLEIKNDLLDLEIEVASSSIETRVVDFAHRLMQH